MATASIKTSFLHSGRRAYSVLSEATKKAATTNWTSMLGNDVKKESSKEIKNVFWMKDLKTDYWMRETGINGVDVAQLKEMTSFTSSSCMGKESSEEINDVSWSRHPITGCWIPKNHFCKVNVALFQEKTCFTSTPGSDFEKESSKEIKDVSWMRDPKSGYWIPETHFNKIDVAQLLREISHKKIEEPFTCIAI